MTFTEYVEMNLNKAVNKPENIVTNIVPSEDTQQEGGIIDTVKAADNKKWTTRIVEDEKFLIFNNKYLNISELKESLSKVYEINGYSGYGFSKLDEFELVRYKTIKDIILPEFLSDYNNDELDPEDVANLIFKKEMKELEWHPEILTM